jgi:hypothetical protein
MTSDAGALLLGATDRAGRFGRAAVRSRLDAVRGDFEQIALGHRWAPLGIRSQHCSELVQVSRLPRGFREPCIGGRDKASS